MRRLTRHVLRLAVTQVAALPQPIGVSVNLSVTDLLHDALPAEVSDALSSAGLAAQRLTLEITETVLLSDRTRGPAAVTALRALGCSVAIDDYGTGYSSLSYLQDLEVDEVKLDRAFVAPLMDNVRSAAIVSSTVTLAHALGMRVVAEGVEDAATLARLRGLGADLAQGFHPGRPVPVERLRLDPVALPTASAHGGR